LFFFFLDKVVTLQGTIFL